MTDLLISRWELSYPGCFRELNTQILTSNNQNNKKNSATYIVCTSTQKLGLKNGPEIWKNKSSASGSKKFARDFDIRKNFLLVLWAIRRCSNKKILLSLLNERIVSEYRNTYNLFGTYLLYDTILDIIITVFGP